MNKIITGHNKKILSEDTTETKNCNCKQKESCSLEGKCREKSVIYKCTASVPNKPDKIYNSKLDTQATKLLLKTKNLQKAQLFLLTFKKMKEKEKIRVTECSRKKSSKKDIFE